MYINIDSPKGCNFFWKVLSFYTHYTSSVLPYQPLSTGSGSILGAGASRASSGISIGRTAIVVVCTPYIWSYVSVLPYRWGFGLGNRTRGMLPSLLVTTPRRWSFPFGSESPGARKTLRKNPLVLARIEPGTPDYQSDNLPTVSPRSS